MKPWPSILGKVYLMGRYALQGGTLSATDTFLMFSIRSVSFIFFVGSMVKITA